MDDKKDRVRRIILREMEQCMGREGSKLSAERAALKRRYLGCGYGVDGEREERGFSTYVDRTVMETVEWAKPGLMRVFCTDEIIRFEPRTPAQEQAADDATLYVNQVVFGRNMFRLVHDVLSDGLYQRVGWCIAHCPEREETLLLQYAGLSEQEAVALLADPSAEGEAAGEPRVESCATPQGVRYDISLRRKVKRRDIRIDPVPSENVILSADAQDVESARFIACWEKKTAFDLRKEGYDQELIESLPPMEAGGEMPETGAGLAVNDEGGRNFGGDRREYRIYEAWFDMDLNGDGMAEKVKATFCGEAEACRVLKVEEWPLYRAPLFSACSVPLPHQAVGLCLADLVTDVQDLRTEMTRQYLDSLALGNQGELVVNEGMSGSVEYDSLLARGVGAVHRVKGDATITPLPVATSSGEALQGLEMSSALIERRTGVSSRTQSLQADALQNTATGASIMEEAVNQRLELIARVYAETFFKPLGRYILHLLHRYHDKAVQLRLRGRFMAFDPRRWDPDMDIAVAVGLGTGNRSRLVAAYRQILQIQQDFMSRLGKNSPVRLSHLAYTCRKMAEAAGLESPERFFGTEEDAKKAEAAMLNAPAQPSAEQQKLQLEQQKFELERQKAQTEARRRAWETQSRMALEKQKLEGRLALKAMEMNMEKELDQTRLAMGEKGSELTNIKGVGL
ncbi:portal protein [Mailhella massiliensis]|uniref:portal protein n=1 Tax=Mailhella massiliensis TaxID=1903261 RepID=UPI002355966E|nr:hypothetical protein [Mailhella massiliensis]